MISNNKPTTPFTSTSTSNGTQKRAPSNPVPKNHNVNNSNKNNYYWRISYLLKILYIL
jgi:hypothetical protein